MQCNSQDCGPPGTSGDLSGRWEKAGWGNSDAAERWTSPCLGRYLPRHLCPFTPAAGHQRSRCCSRPGRTEESSEVHRAGCYTPLHTSGHRVHGSFWTPGTCLLPRTPIPPLSTPTNCSGHPAGECSRGAGHLPTRRH